MTREERRVAPAKDDPVLLELDRFGIETISVKTYLWGGWRYTNASDALAAAKRNAAATVKTTS